MKYERNTISTFNWDDLKIFLAVASAGSVRAAAPALGVNQSTVSRRIHALEEKLDIRLFEKLPSGYVITHMGNTVLSHVKRIADELGLLQEHVATGQKNSGLSGEVRLAVDSAFLSQCLIPDLAAFSQIYPGIKVEIISANYELNLSKREADIAIRTTNSPPEHLIGRRISSYAQSVYASTQYMEECQKNARSVCWLASVDEKTRHAVTHNEAYLQAPVHHHLDDVMLQLEAAKAGMGMTVLPCFIGDASPLLRKMPDAHVSETAAVWLLMHPDSRKSARMQTSFSFLRQRLLQYAPIFEGKALSD